MVAKAFELLKTGVAKILKLDPIFVLANFMLRKYNRQVGQRQRLPEEGSERQAAIKFRDRTIHTGWKNLGVWLTSSVCFHKVQRDEQN